MSGDSQEKQKAVVIVLDELLESSRTNQHPPYWRNGTCA